MQESTGSRLRLLKLCSALFIASISQFAFGKSVSDEVVQNLSCQGISAASITSSLNPDVYSVRRHIPKKNWSFNAGLYDLANCWSLAHAQRMFFYMGRNDMPETPDSLATAANMIREAKPMMSVEKNDIYIHEKNYSVIPWNNSFFNSLDQGFVQNVGLQNIQRSFTADTQSYQVYRFHQILQNLDYISAPRERPADINSETYMQLITNLQFHKLTEVLIRPALRAQHVVLAKYYIVRPTGETDFFVYDSNFPDKDNVFTYDPKIRQFTALEIVGPLKVTDPEKPVGMFVVDEADRDQMLSKLVQYYTQKCKDQP